MDSKSNTLENSICCSTITNCERNDHNLAKKCEYCTHDDTLYYKLKIQTDLCNIKLTSYANCCSECHKQNCPFHKNICDDVYVSAMTNIGIKEMTEKIIKSNDWHELYLWQEHYRKKHKLSYSQFLRGIKLEPTESYMLYLMGKHHPINREGFTGKTLIDAIKNARIKSLSSILEIPKRDTETAFYDFIFDVMDTLMEHGFQSFSVKSINEKCVNFHVSMTGKGNIDNDEYMQNNLRTEFLKYFSDDGLEFKFGDIKFELFDFIEC